MYSILDGPVIVKKSVDDAHPQLHPYQQRAAKLE